MGNNSLLSSKVMKELAAENDLLKDRTTANTFRTTAQKSLGSVVSTSTLNNPNRTMEQILKDIIEVNTLDVTSGQLNQWLTGPMPSEKDAVLQKVESGILTRLAAKNRPMVMHANSAAKPIIRNPAVKREKLVCKITVLDQNGKKMRTGTGIFMTDDLLLTCHHVLGDPDNLKNIQVKVELPCYDGHYPDGGSKSNIQIWSAIQFFVKISRRKPLIHASSPTLPENQEIGDWPTDDLNKDHLEDAPNKDHLDYCLLEIEASSLQWKINIIAGGADIMGVTTSKIIGAVSNEFPVIRKPATLYTAKELKHKSVNVTVQTLSSELKLVPRNAGSIKEFSTRHQRVRYGNSNNNLHSGDSGSPITNTAGEIIGLHNASTKNRGQAIPIGPIMDDIKIIDAELFKEIFTT